MFQVELHQTKLAVEQTETRLVQVAAEAKQKQDQLQELKCKVRRMLKCNFVTGTLMFVYH